MYKCVCGKEFRESIKFKKHKDECEEVKEVYNKAKICYCGKNLSVYITNGKVKYQTNCGNHECRSKAASKIFKDKKWSKERKEYYHKNKIWSAENIKIIGDFFCERCNKKFESNTALRAHKASCGKKEEVICEVCGRKFRRNANYICHYLNEHDTTEKGIEYRDKRKKIGEYAHKSAIKSQKRISKLEVYFKNKFLKNLKFKSQFMLHDDEKNTNYFYDCLFEDKNIIIEIDGDYWHINPNKFIYEEMSNYIKEYKKREIQKQEFAERLGYIVLRFWESDIYNNEEYIYGELKKWNLIL